MCSMYRKTLLNAKSIIKSGPVCYQGEPWFAPHDDAYARPIKMDKKQLRHI